MLRQPPAPFDPTPQNPAVNQLKGLLLQAIEAHKEGDLKKAIKGYDKVLKFAPDLPEASNFQAMAQHELGRNAKALNILKKLTKSNPDYLEAWVNLGNVQVDMKRFEEALDTFIHLIGRGYETAELYYYMGVSYYELKSFPKAGTALQRATELDPKHGDAWLLLGNAMREYNNSPGAVEAFEKAIELSPQDFEPYFRLGEISVIAGDFDTAERALKRTLELNPDHEGASQELLKVANASNPKNIEGILRQIDEVDDEERKSGLHFVLGEAYAKNKEYDQSFAHYLKATQIHRRSYEYDIDENMAFFEAIAEVFTPDFLSERLGLGNASLAPIFILGMPRSGTTLTEQILASHSMVDARGEMRLIGSYTSGLTIQGKEEVSFPDSLRFFGKELYSKLANSYLEAANLTTPGKYRVTDKMPANFQFVGLIHLILPQAKIIHCQRNAIDTCLSNFTKKFRMGQFYSYDLTELGKYYQGYQKLMDHWDRLLPGKMLSVRYEDTVTDIETQARRILEFCGLPWEPGVLDFHETERPVWTASAEQVRQPLYNSSVERWRRYEKLLAPLIEALGPLAKV